MKRKLIYISILMAVSTVFQGCKKDFLELKPVTGLVEETFYKTEADALQAVTAVYDAFGYQGYGFVTLIDDIWSDDAYKGGGNAGDVSEWQRVEYQNCSADDGYNIWKRCYDGIFRANLYLSHHNEITWTNQENKKRFEAEVRFLRAYFYWDLETHFGWVPVITKYYSNVETFKTLKQNTPSEVYTQIATDLIYAINNLPEKALPANEIGRATKYAAEGLLARIYLFYSGYAKNTPELGITTEWADSGAVNTINKEFAQKAVNNITNQPQYKLLADYSNLFDWTHQNSTESIFEVQYTYKGNSGDWSSYNIDGNFMCQLVGVRSPVGDKSIIEGWSFGMLTWSLINEFESNDPRKDATVYNANKKLSEYTHGYQNTGYFNNKFMARNTIPYVGGDPKQNFSENRPDIRLSDIYLMKAELYLTDKNDSATFYLNKVRTRALGLGSAKTAINLDDIQHERRVELAGEGLRRLDLMRWGMVTYAKPMIDKTFDHGIISSVAETIDDYQTLGFLKLSTLGMLPIPATEIARANSGVLKQFVPAYMGSK